MNKHFRFLIVILVVASVVAAACGGSRAGLPGAASLEQSVQQTFEKWAASNGEPYQNVSVSVGSNDGFFAQVQVTAEFRPSAVAVWEEREAQVECRKVGDEWQCNEGFAFSLSQAEIARRAEATAAAEALVQATATAEAAIVQAAAIAAGGRLDPDIGVVIATNPKDGAEYVYVPAGPFIMGSRSDPMANDNEMPQQPDLNLDAFWIMRTEVTNAQYAKCVQAGVCSEPFNTRWNDPAYAEHPVSDVDWAQANKYATWVGGRLPTEAEWEKACRSTDGRKYPWGDDPPTAEMANFNFYVGDTTPVGSYAKGASPYGALDMAGNVWEWTSSLYKPYPYAADGRENLEGDGFRTLRGGAWYYGEVDVRCAYRNPISPVGRGVVVGFRVLSPGFGS